MEYLVSELLELVGVGLIDLYTFPELFTWFVTCIFGMELVLFVIDGIFYTVRNIARGIK